jgi:hypothetical protein
MPNFTSDYDTNYLREYLADRRVLYHSFMP